MTQRELVDLLESNKIVTKTRVYAKNNDRQILDITYNSKACVNGSVFFAKGATFKEEYLKDAINNGAFLIVSEKEYDLESTGLIVVSDVREAMVIVAETFFGKAYNDIHMIGLTGTKGKTTTATYIHNILSEYLNKKTGLLSTIQTYTKVRDEESHLSTPEAIELQRYIKEAKDSNLEFLTMEVSSQSYKAKRIKSMPFEIGLFLNISEDHISPNEHPDFNDYLNSKLEFIKKCNTVVINIDTDYLNSVLDASKNASKVILYGSEKDKDKVNLYYTNIRKEDGILTFDVIDNNIAKEIKKETYQTQMMGTFNVQNATAAIAVAKYFNIPEECIKKGLLNTTVSGRMNVFKDSKSNKTIIVDYAHNKLSFEKFFEAVKEDYPKSKIYALFGAPGGKAYIRRKQLAETSSKYADKIYLTADDPNFEKVSDICRELASFISTNYEIIEDRVQAIEKAYNEMEEDGVLCLLAKGEDCYQITKGKFEPYESDTKIAKRLTNN